MASPDLPPIFVTEADLGPVEPDILGLIQAEMLEHFDADLLTEFRYGPGTWLH